MILPRLRRFLRRGRVPVRERGLVLVYHSIASVASDPWEIHVPPDRVREHLDAIRAHFTGTTWESALISAHHKLDNLSVIIDYNKLQAMGETNKILNIEPLKEKWQAFGWIVREIDGHNFEEIEKALIEPAPEKGKPMVIIANTIKGKGWKRAENNNLFHYKAPSKEEYEEAMDELNNA